MSPRLKIVTNEEPIVMAYRRETGAEIAYRLRHGIAPRPCFAGETRKQPGDKVIGDAFQARAGALRAEPQASQAKPLIAIAGGR